MNRETDSFFQLLQNMSSASSASSVAVVQPEPKEGHLISMIEMDPALLVPKGKLSNFNSFKCAFLNCVYDGLPEGSVAFEDTFDDLFVQFDIQGYVAGGGRYPNPNVIQLTTSASEAREKKYAELDARLSNDKELRAQLQLGKNSKSDYSGMVKQGAYMDPDFRSGKIEAPEDAARFPATIMWDIPIQRREDKSVEQALIPITNEKDEPLGIEDVLKGKGLQLTWRPVYFYNNLAKKIYGLKRELIAIKVLDKEQQKKRKGPSSEFVFKKKKLPVEESKSE